MVSRRHESAPHHSARRLATLTLPVSWAVMPRSPITVDRERRALEALTPGKDYDTREVAIAAGLTLTQARDALERMVRRDEVIRVSSLHAGKPTAWRRAAQTNALPPAS